MATTDRTTDDYLSLADWRRQVGEMYADVRARLQRDPVDAHRHWRARRDELFACHAQSPIPPGQRAAFRGLKYFDYDPRRRFTARVRPLPEAPYDVPTSGGGAIRFVRFGAVDLRIGTLELLWLDDYGGGVFLPFRDASAGAGTYGGGRYLLDTAKGADLGMVGDELTLDFNFAYNPSCAYDAAWVCPLAPRGNWLSASIDAGERIRSET